MNLKEIEKEVTEIIQKSEEVTSSDLKEKNFESLSIDSIILTEIIFHIEEKFKISFSDDELYALKSFQELTLSIEKKAS